MTHTESRTHFAMWAVTSAPLILSIDLADAAVVEANWGVVANREVISVSQTWSGHPGYLVQSASKTFVATCVAWTCENHTLPEHQIWAKPQPNGTFAVLLVNIDIGAVRVARHNSLLSMAPPQRAAACHIALGMVLFR